MKLQRIGRIGRALSAYVVVLFLACACIQHVEPGLALRRAAFIGDLDAVKSLIESGVRPDVRPERDGDGETALSSAAAAGHGDIVSFLLVNGADPNAADKRGYTPLIAAVSVGSEGCVDLLISAGADVNAIFGENRTTALGIAVLRGHTSVVRKLLRHGADPRATGRSDQTLVDVAHRKGYPDIERILLEAIALRAAKDR